MSNKKDICKAITKRDVTHNKRKSKKIKKFQRNYNKF